MKIKEFILKLKGKIRFELWFVLVLVLVAVVTFLLFELIFGALKSSVEKSYYKVRPLDEKSVYNGIYRDFKEDFQFLFNSQPSYLNGAPVKQNISRGQITTAIIENYTPIRDTQKGLEEAAIIYETPAEGGITRLLAIYTGDPVDAIGPIRSARPYFITWASEYRAGLAHVGGSQEALNNLKTNFRLFNIDELADNNVIWRNNKYLAPHNAFTSTSGMLNWINREKYYHPLTIKRFPFKEPDDDSGDIKTITIDFSTDPYEVKYLYDDSTYTYERYNGGKKHHNIKPANIVIQFVNTEVLDDVGRLRIQTHGTGKSLVFRDGKVIEGTWEKDSSINSKNQDMSQSWTKFFDKNGDEIELNRGQIWIEVVPNGRPVNYF